MAQSNTKYRTHRKMGIMALLLMCLIAPLLTTVVVYKYQQKSIRACFKVRLMREVPASERTIIKIPNKSAHLLKWKHQDEFEFQHKMYDVVQVTTHGDSIFYHCFPDKKEDDLKRDLAKKVGQALGTNGPISENQKHISQFVKKLFCQVSEIDLNVAEPKYEFEPAINQTSSSIYASLKSLPPERV